MAKKSKHVLLFLRAASTRFTEASALRERGLTLGGVYLAGYSVECVLKALVLSFVAEHDQKRVLAMFRGGVAHDYGWLIDLYRTHGGPPLPKDVARSVSQVGKVWDTSLRYNPAEELADADEVFRAVEAVLDWSDERV